MTNPHPRRSALLVEPRPEFLQLVDRFHRDRGQSNFLKRNYHPEENAVWLIPSIPSLGSQSKIDEYLLNAKPWMLVSELDRFRLPSHSIPGPISAGIFDLLFHLAVRDSAEEIPANHATVALTLAADGDREN